jgi:hypothetical protein
MNELPIELWCLNNIRNTPRDIQKIKRKNMATLTYPYFLKPQQFLLDSKNDLPLY